MIWWLRLGELWHCPYWEARDKCDSADLEIYKARYRMAPWDGAGDDERAGTVAASIVNFGGLGGRKRMVGKEDLIPRLRVPTRRKTAREIRAAGIRAFGGR